MLWFFSRYPARATFPFAGLQTFSVEPKLLCCYLFWTPKQNIKFTNTIWNKALNKNYMESDCDYTESLNLRRIFIQLPAESHVRAGPAKGELQAQLRAGDTQDSLRIPPLSLQDGEGTRVQHVLRATHWCQFTSPHSCCASAALIRWQSFCQSHNIVPTWEST